MPEYAFKEQRRAVRAAVASARAFSHDRRHDVRAAAHVALNQSPAATAVAQLSAALNGRGRPAGPPRADVAQRLVAEGVDLAEVDRQLAARRMIAPVRRTRIKAAQAAMETLSTVQAVVDFCLVEPETMEQTQRRLASTPRVADIVLDQQQLSVHEGHLQLGVFRAVADERHQPGTTWELANVPVAGRSSQRFSFHVHPSGHGTKWIPGAEMHAGHQNGTRQTPDAIVAWLNANHPFQG